MSINFKPFLGINLLITVGLLILFFPRAWAQTPKETTTTRGSFSTRIDKTHSIVSKKIINTSLRIDNILGHDEVDDETPSTHVRLRLLSTNNRFEGQAFKTRISSKLSLPRTQKRLHLIINNLRDDEKKDSIETKDDHYVDAAKTPQKSLEGENFIAGVRQMIVATKNFHFHADAGAKLKMPIDPYLRIKARQSFEPGGFATHFTQHAFAYQYDGYGYDLGLSFDKPLGYDFLLRQSNRGIYRNTTYYYQLENGISLIQPLGKKRSIVYFVSSTGVSKPTTHVTSWNFGVTYRTPIEWKWMILEVTPMINYSRAHNFGANPGITFQLETTFGAI